MKRIAMAVAVSFLAASCGGQEGEDEDLVTAESSDNLSTGSCGVERWTVKTGSDVNAGLVNMTPLSTSIYTLRNYSAPSSLGSSSPRFTYTGSPELRTFKLTNVTMTEYKMESDSDYHLVLKDSSGRTMIAEIPYPGCASSASKWKTQITAARNAFDAHYTASTSFKTANATVTLTGVGFFDILHGQTGVAPNGIELHSVLSICFGTNC